MGWDKLNLYVEHLFPGFLTLVLAMALFGYSIPELAERPSNHDLPAFVIVGAFISGAYVLGVIFALISRMLVDGISDWTFTPFFFGRVARQYLGEAPSERRERLRAYDDIFARATVSRNAAHRTNVAKARERVHLVRTCFVPISLAFALFFQSKMGWDTSVSLLISFPLGLLAVVPLFAYGEGLIYRECLKNHELRTTLGGITHKATDNVAETVRLSSRLAGDGVPNSQAQ